MYTVTLSHRPNPDMNRGYPCQPNTSGTPQTHQVETLEYARTLCRRYIDGNALGSGNWSGGQVHDEDGALVGRIAFNGRFFYEVPA